MEHAKLVLRCLLIIAGFGALFGGVCALICPEVFTLGRPPSFGNLPAPVLGMLWGWLDFLLPGVMVGMAVGLAANVGNRPAVKAMFFAKPLWRHALLMAVGAVSAGLLGWLATRQGMWEVAGKLASALPPERHEVFSSVWWGTLGAHTANFAGGIALAIWTWRKRTEFEAMVNAKERESNEQSGD
jgi:hypothetical protein